MTTTDQRRGPVFWVRRYLPAEVAGTATALLAGLAATAGTIAPTAIGLAAALGEGVGFDLVLAAVTWREVRRTSSLAARRRAGRVLVLLAAEFGAAEALDTLLVRPAAMALGVWLLGHPVPGLLVGKVLADLVFYSLAAGAFTLTARTGLRDTPDPTR